ncbi:unnamed protein product, partial [marine sediment metagenome]
MAGQIDNNQEHILEEAVQQFVDAQLRGQDPDIDEFVKQYPEFERRLRQRIENLQKIDALFDSLVQAGEEELAPTASFGDSVVRPGRQIGQFRIERELGRGGAGVVYLAHDTKLDRPVAIKSLPVELMDNPKARSRFAREARVLASLNHPNIATIYEELKEAEGAGYLVLEYISGDT